MAGLLRYLAFILVVAGLALVVGAAGWLYYHSLVSNPGAEPLPDTIAGLPLTRALTGRPAVQEINHLHGLSFSITSGAVGFFGGQQVVVWVSGSPLGFLAGQMQNEMEQRIAEGRSPFTPLDTRRESGRAVLALEGLGQQHYYFRSGRQLVWLAADAGLAEQALAEVLEFYPQE
jgi:hypothetical protein